MRQTSHTGGASERFSLLEPYAARRVRFLELWEPDGWRIKLYGIAYRGSRPRPALVAAAKQVARSRLPAPARSGGRYGVGFMGVHQGRDANLVFVDWWANENELHHHVYTAAPEAPTALEYVTPTGLGGCVWDLAVIGFERQAWIETVLASAEGSDLARYLARRFEGAA